MCRLFFGRRVFDLFSNDLFSRAMLHAQKNIWINLGLESPFFNIRKIFFQRTVDCSLV